MNVKDLGKRLPEDLVGYMVEKRFEAYEMLHMRVVK